MESWFVSTMLITLSMGLVAFINKIFAERKYNQKFASIILWGTTTILSLVYLCITGGQKISFYNIILLVLWGMGSYLYVIVMMTALRYLPTSTYFISVRLLSSIIMLFAGMIFFSDNISLSDWIGFSMGVIAMLLLFEKDGSKKINYKKGIVWMLIGVVTLVAVHTLAKIFSAGTVNTSMVLLTMTSSAFLTSLFFGFRTIKLQKHNFLPIFRINFIQAGLFFYYFVVLLKVYGSGDLGISYKIQSYSPFIPIVLAAIVYKEKITTKKKVALVLVAVSLWFFM